MQFGETFRVLGLDCTCVTGTVFEEDTQDTQDTRDIQDTQDAQKCLGLCLI